MTNQDLDEMEYLLSIRFNRIQRFMLKWLISEDEERRMQESLKHIRENAVLGQVAVLPDRA